MNKNQILQNKLAKPKIHYHSKIQNSLSLSEILQILERCSTENSRDFQETLTFIKRINRQVEGIDTSQEENLTSNTSPTKDSLGLSDETNTILEDIADRSKENSKLIRHLVEIIVDYNVIYKIMFYLLEILNLRILLVHYRRQTFVSKY